MKHSHHLGRSLVALAALAALGSVSGCITSETVRPLTPESRAVWRELRAEYTVELAGEVVGRVQEFGGSAAADRYWSVMNPWGQEVGLVDDLGRFWRHVPHEELPEHVGSGTLTDGLVRLLDLVGEPTLVAVGVGAEPTGS
jgi:hypothetical protein